MLGLGLMIPKDDECVFTAASGNSDFDLLTEDGDRLVTEAGDPIVTEDHP